MYDDPSTRDPTRLLRRDFSLTISAAHRRAAGNPSALKALTSIERRADAAKQRARKLHRVFEHRWTAKEIVRLWRQHLKRSAQLDVPAGAKRTVDEKELERIAASRVQAWTNRRLTKIENIKTRMANAVVRNLGSPSLTTSFKEATPVVWPPLDEVMKRKQRQQQ